MPNTDRPDEAIRVAKSRKPGRPHRVDSVGLARLSDEWMNGDETEQRETFETLRRGLDEDRPEGYKLFP
jgi:hypothetical protein